MSLFFYPLKNFAIKVSIMTDYVIFWALFLLRKPAPAAIRSLCKKQSARNDASGIVATKGGS